MKKVILCILALMLLLAGCTSAEPSQPNEEIKPDEQLMEEYPEYFGLDTSEGLDVYVWQMAEHSYSFGLLPHSETTRDWLDGELMDLRGVGPKEMREILASYDINQSWIYIIPWQNPFSSYIAEYWIDREGEDLAQKQRAYVKFVEMMLFMPQEYHPFLDDAVFDVDGDGKEDYCTLSVGPTSGIFSFTFRAFDPQSEAPKYEQTFCTEVYELSFRYDFMSDNVYIKAVTLEEEPQTYYYLPVIQDGQVTIEKIDYKPFDITVVP